MALGFAWAAYPYALFALETNSNDSLVGMLTVLAMLGLTHGRPAGLGAARAERRSAWPRRRSSRRWPWRRCSRPRGEPPGPRCGSSSPSRLAAVLVAAFAPFVPDGGLREIYDRTVGYQASRPSPFSVWGQNESLEPLRTAVQAGAVLLGLAVAFVPRRKTPVQVAALAAAVLIAVQLGVTHWFYLYVVWFAPLALVALMAPWRGPARARAERRRGRPRARARRRVRRLALLLLGAGFLLVTFGPQPFSGPEESDLPVYAYYADLMLHGDLPYRDFGFEYPPLAAPLMALGGIAGTGEREYELAFAALTFAAALRGGAARRRRRRPHRWGSADGAAGRRRSRCCSAGRWSARASTSPRWRSRWPRSCCCAPRGRGPRSPCWVSGRSPRASPWWLPRWRSPGWSRAASAARRSRAPRCWSRRWRRSGVPRRCSLPTGSGTR